MKVVKLLKNEIYPTYQLYAHMANKKTDPAPPSAGSTCWQGICWSGWIAL